jgi:hypothetical protein
VASMGISSAHQDAVSHDTDDLNDPRGGDRDIANPVATWRAFVHLSRALGICRPSTGQALLERLFVNGVTWQHG